MFSCAHAIKCNFFSTKLIGFHKISIHRNYISNRKTNNSTKKLKMTSISVLEKLFDDESSRIKLISDLYSNNPQLKFSVVTCGGADALAWIFTTPGASACVVDASIPYSYEALGEFLHTTDDEKISACSQDTALNLARSAYIKAATLVLKKSSSFVDLQRFNILGVSSSASLATNRPKMGPHICFVGAYSSDYAECAIVNFKKNTRTRQQEEELTARAIIASILSSKGFVYETSGQEHIFRCLENAGDIRGVPIAPNVNPMKDPLEDDCIYNYTSEQSAPDYLDCLISSKDDFVVCVGVNDKFKMYPNIKLPPGTLIVPGSFNPLHDGHVMMAVAALKANYGWEPGCGKENPPVLFEISAVNADKGAVSKEDLMKRLAQFQPSHPIFLKYGITNVAVVMTRMPLFIDKSKLFPNCNFLLGADTLERLLNPKYYSHDIDVAFNTNVSCSGGGGMAAASVPAIDLRFINMASIFRVYQERGQKFIVGGRVDNNNGGVFKTGQAIINDSAAFTYLTKAALSIFTSLSEQEYRLDISSTEIRAGNTKP